MDEGETLHQTSLSEITGRSTDPQWAAILGELRTHGASAAQAMSVMTQEVVHQAFYLATLDVFRIFALMTVALLPFIWLTKKAIPGGGHAAAD